MLCLPYNEISQEDAFFLEFPSGFFFFIRKLPVDSFKWYHLGRPGHPHMSLHTLIYGTAHSNYCTYVKTGLDS